MEDDGAETGELRLVRHPRLARLRWGVRRASGILYGGSIAWPIRLASWLLAAIPTALLFGPRWIPVAIVAVEGAWIGGVQAAGFRDRQKQRAFRRASFSAFGVPGSGEAVNTGLRTAWRAGDLILKRAPSNEEWAWLGEHLPMVGEDGFRLALPVPASDGRWVVDGWCAQTWVAGSHPAGDDPRWLDVLAVCAQFHRAAAHLPRPPFVEHRTHPWAVGDRVAWSEEEPPVPEPLMDRLLAARRPLDLPAQLIHGDLSENVLFAPDAQPAVIDPTPYWRPAGFASAIVVADAIVWGDVDPAGLLDTTSSIEGFPQLFVRALIFRLVAGSSGVPAPETSHPYRGAVDLAVELAR